jgi:SOS-response transcriptional repressor LexA
VARPVSRRETKDDRINLNIEPSLKKRLDEYSARHRKDRAAIMREATQHYMAGRLPVIGKIPCGPLELAIEATHYMEMVSPALRPRADLGDYLLEASGDSMAPRIESGDLVMLRPGIEWSEGEVCAVQLFADKNHEGDCEAALKRVFHGKFPDQIILRSYNPQYADKTVFMEQVQIVGVMKGLIKVDG